MNGGDLRQFLNEKGQLEEATAKYFFLQMVLALQYIHQRKVVHWNLKPANILMSSQSKTALLKELDFY
jgi:serine/threonine protein kinase